MSTRPGPLESWPVEHFYPEVALLSPKTPIRPNKRPHSPAAVPLSPAKRRLLNDAGFHVPGKGTAREMTASPSRRPETVATRLDFGSLAKSARGHPLFPSSDHAASSHTLAPSLRPLSSSPDEDDSPFKAPVSPTSSDSSLRHIFRVYEDETPPILSPRPQPPLLKDEIKENAPPPPPPVVTSTGEKVYFSPDPKTAELQKKFALQDMTPKPAVSAKSTQKPTSSSVKKATKKSPVPASRPQTRYMTRSATKADKRWNGLL